MPQTKVVDTRKATAVNMDKYDEKLQDMADARTGNSRRDQRQTQGKEKIRSKSGRRSGPQSNKSKQEEADRAAPPAAGGHQKDPRHRADPR